MAKEEQKLLTFCLDKEEYGISIVKVKELIGMMDITKVPRTPEYVKGVINLRGKIIPVMDLRIKFGLVPQEYTDRTCIIVVEAVIRDKKRILGIIVDTVSEVVSLPTDSIEPPPEYGSTADQSSIFGIAKIEDNVVIILDIDKIFMNDDITRISDFYREGNL